MNAPIYPQKLQGKTVYTKDIEEGDYDLAQADVAKWFSEFGPDGLKEKVKL